MTRPERIQLRRARGWRLPAGAVVVSRPTPWGNPFKVGVDGPAAECVFLYRALLAGYVVVTCHAGVAEQIAAAEYARGHIAELRGKAVACWCRPGAPCHGDVLLEVANDPEAVDRLRGRKWPGKVREE